MLTTKLGDRESENQMITGGKGEVREMGWKVSEWTYLKRWLTDIRTSWVLEGGSWHPGNLLSIGTTALLQHCIDLWSSKVWCVWYVVLERWFASGQLDYRLQPRLGGRWQQLLSTLLLTEALCSQHVNKSNANIWVNKLYSVVNWMPC